MKKVFSIFAILMSLSTTAQTNYDVTQDATQNQVRLKMNDGSSKYYNTTSVESIDVDGTSVTVSQQTGNDTYNTISNISFQKAIKGEVSIIEAKGWLESAYVKFGITNSIQNYNVYIKGGQYTEYTKIDRELVRKYGTYGRADIVGLKAANDYQFKVVPVNGDGTELTQYAAETETMEVKSYSRQGFAFMNNYEPGAYKADGTLKSGAKVIYVTSQNAKTVKATLSSGEFTGIQAILNAYQKGNVTTPLAVRIIGTIYADNVDSFGSSEEGIQIKGKNAYSELNITVEGIGDDATIHGFGFLVRNSKSVEFRNFGIMLCMDDGLSLDTDNSNIWIHHMDVFYGPNGSGDHAKGDGSVDVKGDSKLITVSYNRFWDTGKTNMFGMKSETGPNYISYDHNWFDHSDSRHPRVRTMSVHVWNNYFDNVAKYGVGATTGASVFVENNYFLKTKKPILSSLQGTDAEGSGTFSDENGGMIKAYGNYFDSTCKNFKYYTQKNASDKGYDAYETATRDEQIPTTEVTKVGSTPYNNFDTDATLMYTYTTDAADDVPSVVTGFYGAGRMNHGDFTYSFPDNTGTDSEDAAYDSVLGGLLKNYKSNLVGIYGDEGNQEEDNPGGGDTPTPEGTILASFDGSPSLSMFTMAGDYGDGKITYEGTSYKKGVKLNSKGSLTFTPTKNYQMTLILSTAKIGRDVKINGTLTTVTGTENAEGNYYELQPIAITADTEYVITKGSAESILMLIKLVPINE